MHVVLLTCSCAWSASMDAHLQLIFILDHHDAFTSSQYNTHTHTHMHVCTLTANTHEEREREGMHINVCTNATHTIYKYTLLYCEKSE